MGIALAGGAVVLAGVAMLVLPGPGLVTIVLGLGILSLEFQWARQWLYRARARMQQTARVVRERVRERRNR